jgi:alkylation response protein AidB-like acyl-CoA dehydrogenase
VSGKSPVTRYFTTENHERLREEVREFAEANVRPRLDELEESLLAADLSWQVAKQGWIGVTIGREYGGMGAGHVAKLVILEEASRVSGAIGAMIQASELGVAKIINFGSEEQKRRWLPAVAAGDHLPTIAVTGPEAGSYVLAMEASGVWDGDDYILNGRKVFIGNSHIGTLHGVVVRTEPGNNGLSAFMVEADRPGLRVEPQRAALGLAGFSFGELVFENCRVPAANMIGPPGAGKDIAYSSSIVHGRLNLGGVTLGLHVALVEDTIKFVKEQQRNGAPMHAIDAVRQQIGEMASRLETGKILLYHAAHLLDHDIPCDDLLINAKHRNVELAQASAKDAKVIHGALGLYPDLSAIGRYSRDLDHMTHPAGAPFVQQRRMGEYALGLANGHWSERLGANGHTR